MTSENPTPLEKVKNAISNKINSLIDAHNDDEDAHGLGDINDFIDSNLDNVLTSEIVDAVSDGDLRPVTSNAVYDEINDINELLMWILEQDVVLNDDLENRLENLLSEE